MMSYWQSNLYREANTYSTYKPTETYHRSNPLAVISPGLLNPSV